jgi:hypothetical protein
MCSFHLPLTWGETSNLCSTFGSPSFNINFNIPELNYLNLVFLCSFALKSTAPKRRHGTHFHGMTTLLYQHVHFQLKMSQA